MLESHDPHARLPLSAATRSDAAPSTGVEAIAYDAFISYGQSGDGGLAETLQNALVNFGKPWYRLRMMRVFRDRTDLSANPDLWGTLRSALLASRTLVLLAGPESAASKWVAREISEWTACHPAAHVLIVVTAGEIKWDDKHCDFDWQHTTAAPRALQGRYPEEPLWVDLRAFVTSETRSMRNPAFADAVASLAAAILGRSKSDLVGQDVRQHRIARRTAWSAVAALVLLLITASAAAVFATIQKNLAQAETRLATSRALAAQSLAQIDARSDLALVLAAEALHVDSNADTKYALYTALARRPRLRGIVRGAAHAMAFSAEGKRFFALTSGHEPDGISIAAWDTTTLRKIAAYRPTEGPANGIAVSPNGRYVAASLPHGIAIWRSDDVDQPPVVVASSGGGGAIAFSPADDLYSVRSVETGAASQGPDLKGVQVIRLHQGDWQHEDVVYSGSTSLGMQSLSPHAHFALFADGNASLVLVDLASGGSAHKLCCMRDPARSPAFSGDESTLALVDDSAVWVWDTGKADAAPSQLRFAGDAPLRIALDEHGKTLAGFRLNTTPGLFTADLQGRRLEERDLHKLPLIVEDIAFAPRDRLATVADTSVALWDSSDTPAYPLVTVPEETAVIATSDSTHIATLREAGGDRVVIHRTAVDDPSSVHETSAPRSAFVWPVDVAIADDRFIVTANSGPASVYDQSTGNTVSIDLGENEEVSDALLAPNGLLILGGHQVLGIANAASGALEIIHGCPGVASSPEVSLSPRPLAVSRDGRYVAWGCSLTLFLRDRQSGTTLRNDAAGLLFSGEFADMNRILATGDFTSRVRLWSVPDVRLVSSVASANSKVGTMAGNGQLDPVAHLTVTPDSKLLAVQTLLGGVSLFDPATGQPIAKLADPPEASGDTPPPPYLGFRPGGFLVAVARNQVTRWSVDLEIAARSACLRANARLSPDEVRRYVGIAGYRPFCDTVVPEPEALLEGAAPIIPM